MTLSQNPARLGNPQYQEYEYTLAAGESLSLPASAEFVACLAATATFKMGFNNGPKTGFEAGLKFQSGFIFSSIDLHNPGGAPNTIRIGVGLGDIVDARLVLTGTISTKEAVPDVLTSKSPVSALNAANTVLAAANTLRKEAFLVNEGAGTVYINGTVAVLAGEGVPLASGQSLVLENTDALYARNDSGAAVSVSVTESEFST